jgi:pimeloyl-ACP methyl ester carboxylesterase
MSALVRASMAAARRIPASPSSTRVETHLVRSFFRAVLALTVMLTASAASAAASAANTVETTYDRPGPYSTTTSTASDDAGHSFAVYRPADYSALGFASPILTWGDGSDATPSQYTTVLTRLASYGFTAIASTLTDTGSGKEIDAGASYLVAQNSLAASVYHDRLDTARVGVFGHSQGATGAVNAATHNPSRYAAVITFSLPDQRWSGANADCPTAEVCTPHPDQLRAPTFLIATHGLADAVIASPSTETAYFDSVPVHAALGLVGKGADHATPEDGDHPDAELGYATAWFLYQLRGDTAAAAAFTGPHPELTGNPDWPCSLTK